MTIEMSPEDRLSFTENHLSFISQSHEPPAKNRWVSYNQESNRRLQSLRGLSDKAPVIATFPGAALAMIAMSPRLGIDIFTRFEQKITEQMTHDQAERRIVQTTAELAKYVGKFDEFMEVCAQHQLIQCSPEATYVEKVKSLQTGVVQLLKTRTEIAKERTALAIAETPMVRAENKLTIVETEEKWAKKFSGPRAATQETIRFGLQIAETGASSTLEAAGKITQTAVKAVGGVTSSAIGTLSVAPAVAVGFGAEVLAFVPAAIPPMGLGASGAVIGMAISINHGFLAFTEATNWLGLAPDSRFWLPTLTGGTVGFAVGCAISFFGAMTLSRMGGGIGGGRG